METKDQRGNSPPSRGEAKEEEEEGGALSPSLPVAPERKRGNDRDSRSVLSYGLIVILVGMIVYFIYGVVLWCPPFSRKHEGPPL